MPYTDFRLNGSLYGPSAIGSRARTPGILDLRSGIREGRMEGVEGLGIPGASHSPGPSPSKKREFPVRDNPTRPGESAA